MPHAGPRGESAFFVVSFFWPAAKPRRSINKCFLEPEKNDPKSSSTVDSPTFLQPNRRFLKPAPGRISWNTAPLCHPDVVVRQSIAMKNMHAKFFFS